MAQEQNSCLHKVIHIKRSNRVWCRRFRVCMIGLVISVILFLLYQGVKGIKFSQEVRRCRMESNKAREDYHYDRSMLMGALDQLRLDYKMMRENYEAEIRMLQSRNSQTQKHREYSAVIQRKLGQLKEQIQQLTAKLANSKRREEEYRSQNDKYRGIASSLKQQLSDVLTANEQLSKQLGQKKYGRKLQVDGAYRRERVRPTEKEDQETKQTTQDKRTKYRPSGNSSISQFNFKSTIDGLNAYSKCAMSCLAKGFKEQYVCQMGCLSNSGIGGVFDNFQNAFQNLLGDRPNRT